MKIIKRSGMEDTFDIKKIEAAIRRANNSVIDYEKLTDKQIDEISKNAGYGGEPDHESACI